MVTPNLFWAGSSHKFEDGGFLQCDFSTSEILLEVQYFLLEQFSFKSHFAKIKQKLLKSIQNFRLKLINQQMAEFPEKFITLRTLLGFQVCYYLLFLLFNWCYWFIFWEKDQKEHRKTTLSCLNVKTELQLRDLRKKEVKIDTRVYGIWKFQFSIYAAPFTGSLMWYINLSVWFTWGIE